jgi:colanic acid/amylovoran biosynthesis glycosyltransferase
LYGYELRANPNWQVFRQTINHCDSIVVNCDFNKQLLAECVGEELAQDAYVIRHYADIPAIADGRCDRVRVLIVGGFEERKGHDILFKAVKALGADLAHVELWVAGYRGCVDVEQLARDLGLSEQVRIFGAVSEPVLDFLYECCDIFCLPSRADQSGVSEGLPVALIEAMAHAKPVISTRLGGIPELVQEILVEENDVQALADALRSFIRDREWRRLSGLRNREIVKAKYSNQNVLAMRDLFLQEST